MSEIQQHKTNLNPREIDARLTEFERKIDELDRAYGQYFAGVELRPPNVLRKEVQRMMFELSNKTFIQQTAQKFRLRALVQRHSTYKTKWDRILRQIEEGTFVRDIKKAKRRAAKKKRPEQDQFVALEIDLEAVDDLDIFNQQLHEMDRAGQLNSSFYAPGAVSTPSQNSGGVYAPGAVQQPRQQPQYQQPQYQQPQYQQPQYQQPQYQQPQRPQPPAHPQQRAQQPQYQQPQRPQPPARPQAPAAPRAQAPAQQQQGGGAMSREDKLARMKQRLSARQQTSTAPAASTAAAQPQQRGASRSIARGAAPARPTAPTAPTTPTAPRTTGGHRAVSAPRTTGGHRAVTARDAGAATRTTGANRAVQRGGQASDRSSRVIQRGGRDVQRTTRDASPRQSAEHTITRPRSSSDSGQD